MGNPTHFSRYPRHSNWIRVGERTPNQQRNVLSMPKITRNWNDNIMKHITASALLAILVCMAARPFTTMSETAPTADTIVSGRDRQDILDLLSRYSHTWDSRDAKGWTDLFLQNGAWQNYFAGDISRSLRSTKERLAFADELHRSFTERGVVTRHHQTNTLLTRNTDGSIQGETVFSVIWQNPQEPAPKLMHSGVYRDVYVKTERGWRFKRREVRVDHELVESENK